MGESLSTRALLGLLDRSRDGTARIYGRERQVDTGGQARVEVHRIMICDAGAADESFVHEAFADLVATCPRVVSVSILRNARIRRMPELGLAAGLLSIGVDSREIRDWTGVGHPQSLRQLVLAGFSEASLQRFNASAEVGFVRVEHPKRTLLRAGVTANVAWFSGCQHRLSLASLRAQTLCVERSRGIDLAEVAAIPGLRGLVLPGMRRLAEPGGLDFLRRRTGLTELVANGVPLSQSDLTPLLDSGIRNAYLQISDAALRSLGARWPERGVLTNGRIAMTEGRVVTDGDDTWAARPDPAPSIYASPGVSV